MWFFSKKKVVKKTEYMVTPKDLIYIIELAYQAIDPSQIEYEVEFKLRDNNHKIGIDYDRISAPKKGYDPQYISFYVDKEKFMTLQELYINAVIDGERLETIGKDIVIDPIYRRAVETGDIEADPNDFY